MSIRNAFVSSAGGLSFESADWSARSDDHRGFVSLRVGDAEFLASSERHGGFAFRKDGTWITRFPSWSTITHDRTVGRTGSVMDGVYLVKLIPDRTSPAFEIYAGYNEREPQELVMLLGDGVMMVRADTSQERAWQRRIVRLGGTRIDRARGAVIVHRDGPSLSTNAPCAVETVVAPDGKERLALVFSCKGFAANTFAFVVEPRALPESLTLSPQFNVKSSDDRAIRGTGPTRGVDNPIYGPHTSVDVAVEFTWLGSEPFRGFAELEVVHALGETHHYEVVDLSGREPGKITARFAPRLSMTGVSDVWGRLCDAYGRVIWTDRYRMAYDWRSYRPRTNAPRDLKAFWDGTLARLRATPLDPVTTRVERFADHPSFEIYDVTFNGWEKKRIHAMLFVPKGAPRPLPAIVTAHPGTTGFGVKKRPDGVYGSKLKKDARFVTIVPLIRGHAPDAKDIPFNNPWWGPLEDRDAYAARSWYCAMVRAIDYLATRGGLVDMSRVVAKGGSQGGALALVTAALDDRVALCLADCPSNCQLHEIIDHYGSFGPSRGQVPPGQTVEDLKRTLSYYDPVNMCPWISCPTYIGLQIGDLTVHSMGGLAAYHSLTCVAADAKGFYPGKTHYHACSPEGGRKFRELMDEICGTVQARPAQRGSN